MTDYVTNVSAVQESLFADNNLRDLAAHGECYEPHPNSEAAQFLLSLLDDAAELFADADADELRQVAEEPNDAASVLDYSGAVHERADAAVPIYSAKLWGVFTALGAFTEDPSDVGFEFGEGADMERAAGVCLYLIARRTLDNLLAEGAERLVVVDADEAKERAAELGAEHGQDAASFAADYLFGGRSTGDVNSRAQDVISAIEDGDPAADEFMPRPDLGGEWADSFDMESLADELSIPYGSDDAELFADLLNEATDEYERAFRDAAEEELTRMARQAMD